jgi:hypothetical protein
LLDVWALSLDGGFPSDVGTRPYTTPSELRLSSKTVFASSR